MYITYCLIIRNAKNATEWNQDLERGNQKPKVKSGSYNLKIFRSMECHFEKVLLSPVNEMTYIFGRGPIQYLVWPRLLE